MSEVRVACRTDISRSIQSSFVLNSDYRVGSGAKSLYISNLDFQSFGGSVPREIILGRFQSSIVDFDSSTISDIGQICHGIDKLYIVIVEVIQIAQSSSQLIRNSVTDIIVGRILPVRSIVSGIVFVFDLLLKGGNIGFYLGGNSFSAAHQQKGQVRSIVLAFHGGNVFDQIVAGRGKSNGASTSDFGSGQIAVSYKGSKLSGFFSSESC